MSASTAVTISTLPTSERTAMADDLRALAALFDREADAGLLAALRERGFPAARVLGRSPDADEAARTLDTVLAGLRDTMPAEALDELAADYASIFLNHALGASPSESVWIDPDGLAWQEPMFEVRAWYRRHGLRVPDWRTRADDHLVAELHFVEILLRRTADPHALDDLARFLDEHLLRWLPSFAARVAARCATRFYASAVVLARSAVDELRERLVVPTGRPRPTREEIDRRMKPARPTPVAPIAFVPGAGPGW